MADSTEILKTDCVASSDNSKEKSTGIWLWIEKIVRFFLNVFFRLIRKELSDDVFNAFMQFVKFGIVGVSNTVLSYLLNIGSLFVFQKMGMSPSIDYLIAGVVAFVISVAWSYYWNNRFVFTKAEGEQRSWLKALIKTYISYSFTGIFLNSILSWIWVNLFHISKLIAPLINLVISVPVNFLINKFWAFKTEDNQ